jgi:hypothetical protein
MATLAKAPAHLDLDQQAIEWLLAADEPGIRLQARRDLLNEDITWTADEVLAGRHASSLLSGQKDDGGFGVHPYQKWMGAHWRLVSLVELGAPASEPRVMAALESVLAWLAADEEDPEDALRIRDRYRIHGSIYANALAVATRLGKASDPRASNVADWLMLWQWPDGGWNCDRHPHVTHSSFYESITPMWALSEFATASGNANAARAAGRAAEFFLAHRLFKSHSGDRVGDPKWLKLRYPEYWHYDYLHGLVMLGRAGKLADERCRDALKLLREQQQADGTWRLDGPQYWKGSSGLYGDPAAWDKTAANQMLTLNALRVLKAAKA